MPRLMGLLLNNLAMMAQGGVASILPLDIDFSTLSDGALPSPLTGATWAISSGKAINTPTTGANIVTDGDMEAVGVTSWADAGSPTTKEKSTVQKHGGAQSLHIVAPNSTGAQNFLTAVAGQFYEVGGWQMMVSGVNSRLLFGFGFHNVQLNSAAAEWSEVKASDWTTTTSPRVYIYTISDISGEIFADDVYVLPYNNATLVFTTPEVSPLVAVGADWTIPVSRQAGVDVCIDDPTNPKYFVRGLYDRTTAKVYLLKYVNGAMTALIDGVSVAYSAGATVEVRHPAPNTFQLFYGDTQRGTDQVVSDAGIIDNGYHGAFSTGGGAQLDRFFCNVASPVEQGALLDSDDTLIFEDDSGVLYG